jgi:superfamily II DNA or RNA helicase
LFIDGVFNNLDVDDIPLSKNMREIFSKKPEAAALYEYSSLINAKNEQVSKKVADEIRTQSNDLDYKAIFKKIFYNVSYTDYLFSLPMGAGKTYLMAAFIYLDLYFASIEPTNTIFAHNFIIFAPSGLKSSVVPSLKTIKNFDPSWIIPDPSASAIKRLIKFEVLDQPKSASKSNRIKNPNVQKIAFHQPLEELIGLVAVTNAEKVILDRIIEKDGIVLDFKENEDSEDNKYRMANELRDSIGKLPNLSIFIDEVHHAVSDEIKLRSVVNKWMKKGTLNSVIGFSGTPYLEKGEKIIINNELSIAATEISNIVYFYPLIYGIDNFLKRPTVKISDSKDSLAIVESGIRMFLDQYKDKKYSDGTVAKRGIYCGTIEKLEEQIYPLAESIVSEYGLDSTESILKVHRGNKQYSIPVDSQMEFDILDKAISKIRIILLVQIGKEGWDCKSLTGIILSQEGDCPKNMVLQTSCRCLRQVDKGENETALIYLNDSNSKKLNEQLTQQHHITIRELETFKRDLLIDIRRYDRTEYLHLPDIDFYQLKIEYKTLIIDENINIKNNIDIIEPEEMNRAMITTQNFNMEINDIGIEYFEERGNEIANYNSWLYTISKESFGFLNVPMLSQYNEKLRYLYKIITYEKNGYRYFSSKYNIALLNKQIRLAFYQKRSFITKEELISHNARLLNIENFSETIQTSNPDEFFPVKNDVERIIDEDSGKSKITEKVLETIESLRQIGKIDLANELEEQYRSYPMKDKSFHYLPYHTDSKLEQDFLSEVLQLTCFREKNLEIYYNGDDTLTDFKIKCFRKYGASWKYIGMYIPDFLIINRKENKIHKAIIVETKGQIYANDPKFKEKKIFMKMFKEKNNEKYGYERFEYLYLEDSLPNNERIRSTINAIEDFF